MKTTNDRVEYSLAQLAEETGATLHGNASTVVRSAAPIESAGPGQITFVANKAYAHHLETTNASAVILHSDVPFDRLPSLRSDNPYLTFARVVDLLYPPEALVDTGVHSSAILDDSVDIAATAAIGPLCHIRAGSFVGDGSQIVSSVYVGNNVKIGRNCLIYPGVRIMDGSRIGNNVIVHSSTVIGSDGFGFAQTESGHKKIRQIGWVEIEDDVEIGSNCSIDRGALGPTRIGAGTKIDNLVQIAHNVQIGKNSLIVAQVGISGSARIGEGVVLAGQAGIVGHIEIGDGVVVGAQSGVSKSIPAGQTWFGYPAREIMKTKRIEASLARLPDFAKRLLRIEKKLKNSSGS